METVIAVIVALVGGYVIGRVHSIGKRADRDFKQWQACLNASLTAEALKPKEPRHDD